MSSPEDHVEAGELEGVFLDFYGTVAGGDRLAVETICDAVITDHGLSLRACDLAMQWGHRYFAAIESCDGACFRTLVEIEKATLIETLTPLVGRVEVCGYIARLSEWLAAPTLYDEVREVLSNLDLPICVVSNADDRELHTAIERLELRFEHVVSSETAGGYKPGRRIFEFALQRTGWSRQAVIHVGDSLHSDVGGARAAGLRAAWVHRTDRIGDIGTEKPDWTWGDLKPLLELNGKKPRE
jgi:2-haloacid dehalogenase/putative hydrolase of the HAD superfamily